MKMTPEQKIFLLSNKIEQGSIFIIGSGRQFTIYEKPSFDSESFSKPILQSVSGILEVKEIIPHSSFLKVNFRQDGHKSCPDFYVLRSNLEIRGIVEMSLMALFYVPYCWIKNSIKKPVKEVK
jgi:hypothetical protein